MPFAIMRCAKLSTGGNVTAALQHCFRERDTPNADDARTPQNLHQVAVSVTDAQSRMAQLLPEKRRKDAVLAVEYLFTASPEWFKQNGAEQQEALFSRSLDWLAAKYGRDRIVVATVHQDETSPHLSAFVVPLTADGRLSAKEFIGGRDKMRQDQSSFAEAVAYLGLERGIEGSQATHQTIRQYYAVLQRAPTFRIALEPEAVTPQKTGVFSKESPEQVAKRVEQEINRRLAPTYDHAAAAAAERRRHQELTRTLAMKELSVQKAERLTRQLTPEQAEQLRLLADGMRKENVHKATELQRLRQRSRNDTGHER